MASSKVIAASWSPPNQDRPRQPPTPSRSNTNLRSDHSQGFDSMNFDDILRNICSDPQPFSVDVGGGGGAAASPAMTLEDFLTKAGAVDEEDVRVPAGGFAMEAAAVMSPVTGVPAVQFAAAVGGDGGRGKRKAAVEQVAMDKATQQRQRRMIKNRESAARSRERKQAYTVELEALVTQLEEDNARLMEEEAELNKERYKQLMKNLIPVTEKHKPPRTMKKVHSMEW